MTLDKVKYLRAKQIMIFTCISIFSFVFNSLISPTSMKINNPASYGYTSSVRFKQLGCGLEAKALDSCNVTLANTINSTFSVVCCPPYAEERGEEYLLFIRLDSVAFMFLGKQKDSVIRKCTKRFLIRKEPSITNWKKQVALKY